MPQQASRNEDYGQQEKKYLTIIIYSGLKLPTKLARTRVEQQLMNEPNEKIKDDCKINEQRQIAFFLK